MADDRYELRPSYTGDDTFGIRSTAGAVPVKNQKGQISMQKVKVTRYVTGQRPDYARKDRSSSEDSDSDEEDFVHQRSRQRRRRRRSSSDRDQEEDDEDREEDEEEAGPSRRRRYAEESSRVKEEPAMDMSDPRIRRLLAAKQRQADDSSDEEGGRDRVSRHRRIHEPEVLSEADEDDDEKDDDGVNRQPQAMEMTDSSSSSGDEEMDEDAIERRRELMRQRARARAQIGMDQEEVLDKEEEKEEGSEDEDDETSEEETTDSEEEEGVFLKPVFVRKKDRLTVKEREEEEAKERELERQQEVSAKERRKETLRLVENIVKTDNKERKAKSNDPLGLNEVNTDDENEEIEYETWKLRELKRLKRDREEKENTEREATEIDRLRNMTEEERRLEAKNNPKVVTNKASKGKYKFMQKYYHRGAFFLNQEDDLYKRDFTAATLEDKFDKTVLPKVMQVKNFGRSGRTKYTHLVDQDTTQFDSPWQDESAQAMKFQQQHGGGLKPVFERPSKKKKY